VLNKPQKFEQTQPQKRSNQGGGEGPTRNGNARATLGRRGPSVVAQLQKGENITPFRSSETIHINERTVKSERKNAPVWRREKHFVQGCSQKKQHQEHVGGEDETDSIKRTRMKHRGLECSSSRNDREANVSKRGKSIPEIKDGSRFP